ncbi:type II toxin-antitoxin system RelE/ParE family toxin [Pendulispora rubella]|uniref:Type II toxin-antitoxin system RelE/ParE family toxin n=1 Tax=Pendulispora rubella TaxID=2741070 RepID=A0ABZ2LCT7_9BACT
MTFRFSRRAVDDLQEIADFTKERWGAAQAVDYVSDLYACFRLLGATTGKVHRPPYRRQRQAKHVVFFRVASNGNVFIVRILHERMLPEKHLK